MSRSVDSKFYQSRQWRKTRASYIAERINVDGGLCTRCGQKPGRIVHHILHLDEERINDADMCYGFGNLEFVCLDCHNKIHAADILGLDYSFDANGNPVPR